MSKEWKKFIWNKEYLSFKAAIFDLDNTLYAYKPCNDFASKNLFKKIAKDFKKYTPAQVERIYNESRRETHLRLSGTASMHSRFLYIQRTLEALMQKTDVKRTLFYHDYFWKSYFKKMILHSWVLPLFKDLKKNAIKITILTNLTSELQFKKIIKLGLYPYVDFIVTSEEAGKEKPALETLDHLLTKLATTYYSVFVVGDDEKTDVFGDKIGKTLIINRT